MKRFFLVALTAVLALQPIESSTYLLIATGLFMVIVVRRKRLMDLTNAV